MLLSVLPEMEAEISSRRERMRFHRARRKTYAGRDNRVSEIGIDALFKKSPLKPDQRDDRAEIAEAFVARFSENWPD